MDSPSPDWKLLYPLDCDFSGPSFIHFIHFVF